MRLSNRWASRWARLLGVTLAALFLVPVPALALTFLGPWQVLSNFHSAGIPAAIVSLLPDTTNGKGPLGILSVNMGNAQPGTAGVSSVVIQRQFEVSKARGERLFLNEDFGSQLKDAGFAIRAAVGHYQNGRFLLDYNFRTVPGVAGSRPQVFGDGLFISPRLGRPGQTYVLTLSILYTKAADGYWRDHRHRHHHVSHHRFEFGRA
jgi:hypothetical protein